MKTIAILRKQSGVTAVEFAIILPLLLLVVFGIIEFSLLLFNKHVITHACREGARAGIVARYDRFSVDDDGNSEDEVDVERVVTDWLGEHLITFGASNTPGINVEVIDRDTGNFAPWLSIDDRIGDPDDGPCTVFHCPLRVTVTYDYDFLTLSLFLDPIPIRSSSLMLME